jgi:hypothetical protein
MPQLAVAARWVCFATFITFPLAFATMMWQRWWAGSVCYFCFALGFSWAALASLRDGYVRNNWGTFHRPEVGFWFNVGLDALVSVVCCAVSVAGLLGLVEIHSGK